MELGDSAAAPVADGVFGTPHTCDSLVSVHAVLAFFQNWCYKDNHNCNQ
jgi:hypothetical protein